MTSHLHDFPGVLLWYGLCAGLYHRSTVPSYSSGLGRRALRDALRPENSLDRPSCDIALLEFQVMSIDGKTALDFRTSSNAQIEIEIAPCITACLSLFPWAKFRRRKAAVKMHTLLDLHGNIPTFIRVTSGDVHDVNILDEIMPEAGAFYVMDRGYIDFQRLFVFTLSSAFFVVRTKSNVLLQRRYSHAVDKSTGVRSDQTVILTSFESASVYPDALRRVSYFDAETNKRLKFLTNNFVLPALTIAQIYKCRWQVELFFKWIKQHLRIKAFYGTSENAVKTQIWIAVSVYVLVANRTQAVGAGGQSLPNSTDSEHRAFRENAHFMRPSGHRSGS